MKFVVVRDEDDGNEIISGICETRHPNDDSTYDCQTEDGLKFSIEMWDED